MIHRALKQLSAITASMPNVPEFPSLLLSAGRHSRNNSENNNEMNKSFVAGGREKTPTRASPAARSTRMEIDDDDSDHVMQYTEEESVRVALVHYAPLMRMALDKVGARTISLQCVTKILHSVES